MTFSNRSYLIPFIAGLRENILSSLRLECRKSEFHLHPWPWPGLPEQTVPEGFYLIMALMLTHLDCQLPEDRLLRTGSALAGALPECAVRHGLFDLSHIFANWAGGLKPVREAPLENPVV